MFWDFWVLTDLFFYTDAIKSWLKTEGWLLKIRCPTCESLLIVEESIQNLNHLIKVKYRGMICKCEPSIWAPL
jgi:hypothetical protein